MNRLEEYQQLMKELEHPSPATEGVVERAVERERLCSRNSLHHRTKTMVTAIAGFAACFIIFVVLVNFCSPIASACSKVPGLSELAEAVTFSRSLKDAVENEYFQPMNLSQSKEGVTVKIKYLIIDQKQVDIIYTLESNQYPHLGTDIEVLDKEGKEAKGYLGSWENGEENGELKTVTLNYEDSNVPDQIRIRINVQDYSIYYEDASEMRNVQIKDSDPWEQPKQPESIVSFEFLLKLDSEFTSIGKVKPVNQKIEIDGQTVTIKNVEIYPTHMRMDVKTDRDNSAWLTGLDFYVEIGDGTRFDTIQNGVLSTGSDREDQELSYRADSTYFYDVENLKIVITGAEWLEKDAGFIHVNLNKVTTDWMPQDTKLVDAKKKGATWTITVKGKMRRTNSMYQILENNYHDAVGANYEYNTVCSSTCYDNLESDEYFEDQFQLENYPYSEVWLTPRYSSYRKFNTPITVIVKK